MTPQAFEQAIGNQKIADYIREEVLALTYIAHDLGYVEADGNFRTRDLILGYFEHLRSATLSHERLV